MKTHIITVASGLLLLASADLSRATTTFSDDTFNNADWQMSVLFQFGNGGNVTGTQVVSGGNPGSYRRASNIVNSASGVGRSAVLGFHQWLGANYDPSTQGAIDRIDGTLDYRNISGFGDGQAYSLALLQNGKVYHPIEHATFTVSGWQHTVATDLTADDFLLTVVTTTITVDPAQHPDFSASGAPIALGFTTRDATTDVAFTITAGYDNWSMTVNPVSEPGTATLAAMACLCGVAAVVRKHGRSCLRSGPRR